MKITLNLIIVLSFSIVTFSQGLDNYKDIIELDETFKSFTSNLDEIKSVDLQGLLTDDNMFKRHGFIGSNYRRLDIRFISVIKNIDNPCQYFIYGKSRVSDNICRFQGTLEIKESYYIESLEYFNGQEGAFAGEYSLFENSDSKHTGVFKGRFVVYFDKADNGDFIFKDLPSYESNYLFVGTWIGYGKSKSMSANWGDWRIPKSGDLDVGIGDFGINSKYVANGWETFNISINLNSGKMTSKEAREIESIEWWHD